MLTTVKEPLLDRRYGINNPPTLISTLAGSESVAFNSLHVDSAQLTALQNLNKPVHS
ncbi:hypothetical protein PY650_16225 [Rhizobium calliandrae]|uniref:Uncharacterized protein n=1 Tax=Rhizobium calliandrae TaxID=1312182 RepID=A0ABT7KEY2_9HYPH|nr:hypothetical protein [Rhizobium calliandrae]MDL2407185.1 hypothetical protein [Rhizobium calliandrae]